MAAAEAAAIVVIYGTLYSNQSELRVLQNDTMQKSPESESKELLLLNWNQYVEDLNYSSDILNEFVKKNLSSKEAFILSSSLLTLNSRTLLTVESITPEKKYAKFHNYTLSALQYYNSYLWNTAKFFETSEGSYVLKARDDFNKSQDYYNQGKEEALFVF